MWITHYAGGQGSFQLGFCVWSDPDKAYLLRMVSEEINKWDQDPW